jgi:hypothetical protein
MIDSGHAPGNPIYGTATSPPYPSDYDEENRWLVLHRGRPPVAVNLADTTEHIALTSQAASRPCGAQ